MKGQANGWIRLTDDSFFKDFDGNFDNKIFRSSTAAFEHRTYDTRLSIKYAIGGGKECYSFDGKDHRIPPGHYLVVNPKETVLSRNETDQLTEGLSIFIAENILKEVVNTHLTTEFPVEPFYPDDKAIPHFLEKVIPAGHSPFGRFVAGLANAPSGYANWEELFYALSFRLCQSQAVHWRRLHLIQAVRPGTRIEIYHRLERAREFMLDNIGRPLSLDEIARAALLSKYALVRAFKAVYRASPYQFFLQQKIERSKQLLQLGLPVVEVAYRLGFADHPTFTKRFKKETGITPSAFRDAK
ncbi:MAG: helix-turn-helix transcriptional regulator [Phaeodactylibacter sp.]|nr:helix-turn-helix transcriptional regulator [Phaeodactylibacter sp.]